MEGKPDDPATTATPPAGTRSADGRGAPAANRANMDNHEAARGEQELPPYVILGEPVAYSPILDFFHNLNRKLEGRLDPILRKFDALLELSLGANGLYKRTFPSSPDEEHLKETFTCCLSTATVGPVAGTLYLTSMNVTFCSARPLSFAAPHGRAARSNYYYYKIMIPLGKIVSVKPVTMMDNPFPPVKYVHVVTVDSYDFWFMDFVSSDEAVHSLVETVFQRPKHGVATAPAGSK